MLVCLLISHRSLKFVFPHSYLILLIRLYNFHWPSFKFPDSFFNTSNLLVRNFTEFFMSFLNFSSFVSFIVEIKWIFTECLAHTNNQQKLLLLQLAHTNNQQKLLLLQLAYMFDLWNLLGKFNFIFLLICTIT